MRMAGDPISVAENTQHILHLLRLTYLAGCDSHPSCHGSWPKVMMESGSLSSSKLDVPNSVTYLNRSPMFEWYVVGCDFPKSDTKLINTHLKEIGLRVLNMMTMCFIS